MTRGGLFHFELKRALQMALSPGGLLGLAGSLIVILILFVLGPSAGDLAQSRPYGFAMIGFMWAAAAAVHTSEGNRRSLLSDVWWRLAPRSASQTGSIYLAWSVVAFFQGLCVAAALAIVWSAPLSLLAAFIAGFAAGIPFGVVVSCFARIVNGAAFVMGIALLALVLLLKPAANAVSGLGSPPLAISAMVIAAYLVIAVFLWRRLSLFIVRG